jgi:salicylate hydroxylase
MQNIISCLKSALKWKLLHFEDLSKWTRGCVTLLGDASHPTLPYLGQGAAMAVEDGAVLGILLGRFQSKGLPSQPEEKVAQLTSLLKLYEDLRKKRAETTVNGAALTRDFYHYHDGPEQQSRDEELIRLTDLQWKGASRFRWGDAPYQKDLLGFDVVTDTEQKFDAWYGQMPVQNYR